jgi:hypothetical protein
MQHDEILDLGLAGGGQRVIGGAQIGEFRLAFPERTRARHAMRVKHRQRGGNSAERSIGMPQPVAELVEAARIVTAAHASPLVEIGDVGHLRP